MTEGTNPTMSSTHHYTVTGMTCGHCVTSVTEEVQEIPGVEDASVDIVWDPPWHQSMISAAGRARLGLE